MASWRERFDVPLERVTAVLERAVAEVRRRTLEHIELPPGEEIEITLVRDQPWSAYN